MRGIVQRTMAVLMALILLAGQILPSAAQAADFSDSQAEPPVQSAQSTAEPDASKEEPAKEDREPDSDADADWAEQAEDDAAISSAEPSERSGSEPADDDSSSDISREQPESVPESAPVPCETTEQTIEAQFETKEESVITLSGELPEGAEVLAADAAQEAEQAGLDRILCAYDITINDGWQPEEAVDVSIVNDDITDSVQVYHIGEDGKPEQVRVTHSENGEVIFSAEGFSIYVVTDGLYRRTYEFMDYKFGSWLPYSFSLSLPEDPDDPHQGVFTSDKQVLRNGDTLVMPSMPNKDGMRFLGWYTSPTADVSRLTPERGGVKNNITADSIVMLYARYGNPAALTFYTLPEGSTRNQVFNTHTVILPEAAQSTEVDLTQLLSPAPPEEGQAFAGWVEAGSDTIVNGNAYTVTKDVTLYPRFEQLRKLSFAPADESESYTAPLWVGKAGCSGLLTDHVPTRPGYAFQGWQAGEVLLTDKTGHLLDSAQDFAGGSLADGVLILTGDVTLHAKWTPNDVPYRVLFWLEKPSDQKKLQLSDGQWSVPEEQREYDFLGTLPPTAQAGSQVTAQALLETYSMLSGDSAVALDEGSISFEGLNFRELKAGDGQTNLTVAGDGSSTVNVYYDRSVVTLCFDYPDDVEQETQVAEPNYAPTLPASGTITQKAVTSILSADYPEDLILIGLYGAPISEGQTQSGEAAYWPTSYTVENASYTITTRTMQYKSGNWQQTKSSSASVTGTTPTVSTRWCSASGTVLAFQECFGLSDVLTPTNRVDNLRESAADALVSYYRETEQAVYSSTPASTYQALNEETIVVDCPFDGYELDYFTYTDSRGTPIRREGNAELEQRTLTGSSFTALKVYCKRSVHNLILHNGEQCLSETPQVKYDMSLSSDAIRQTLAVPDLPAELAGKEDQVEFAGWFLDEERTIYLDLAGLKASDRSMLLLRYDRILEIVSVYDYRRPDGQTVPALRMGSADLHLYAGWIPRRLLVQLEPEGGALDDDAPTFFWADWGTTLSVFPVSRDYVPWEEGQDAYIYHCHSYEQAVLDNNLTDRSACYVPATEGEAGERYAYQQDSYQFLGWFQVETSANGSEVLKPYDHERPLTSPVKLRAQWRRDGTYRVVYDPGLHGKLNGSVRSASYQDHAAIALNGNVTPEPGYVFTGWQVRKPNSGGALLDNLYSSGDQLVLNADWAEITLDEYAGVLRGVITLVAQYQPVTGTSITYYVNGGTFVGPSEESQAQDPALVQALKDKLKRDYGANAAHHYLYDSNGAIIGYTVSGIEQNTNITTEDGTWFQRSGYKLMGWSSTPNGPVELELHMGGFNAASDPEGKGHVLYAVWKPEIQVTYNLQGGTWNSANGPEYRQDGLHWVCAAGNGETAPLPYSPSKPGYAFLGWSTSSSAKSGLQTMPKISKSTTLYAVWTTNVVLRFDPCGGTWTSLPKGLSLLEADCYAVSVGAGKSYTLPTLTPVREGGYLFSKWEQGSYSYSPGASFRTSAEQSGQTLTLSAIWSESVSAVEVLVGVDDSISVEASDSLVGAAENDAGLTAPREIEGYQYLFLVYDEEPTVKDDISENYKVTALRRMGENSYQVTLANGQTKIHYPGSVEKLQAVYIQDCPVDVCFKRMNIFEDGMDNMNITLTDLKEEPYTQLSVGVVDIQKALPKPKDYCKNGSSNFTSYTYAIGRINAETMYDIDTMTQAKLWIRQTLNGFAFSVNGEEWKDLERESGSGKDAAIYLIYDNRVETPTTINHTVYGLKSDKEKLFTYQIFVKGRWGFNIGSAAYFLHKPDDPSEELNSYTVALHDKENVLIPLHIDYLANQKQKYKPGDLFYDMFGNDNPTTITNQSELRIWQEVEMRRTNELPFANGTFETSIQMRSISGNSHNAFNGYDTENHLWLKQLGISKFYTNKFSHSFIYTRTSLDVPVHVLELTRNGLELRDEEWLQDGAQTLSVTADNLTVGTDLAAQLVNAPEGYSLQAVQYGFSQDSLSGEDDTLDLRLAAEQNDATLLHVYDYESASSTNRALVPDGSEVYLIYYRNSSTEVPVEYVKKDSSGAYTPVDLSGYHLTPPTVTVTNMDPVEFRGLDGIQTVNRGIETLDAIYLTGRMMLADPKGTVLTTYNGGSQGDWETGRKVQLINGENGVLYTDNNGTEQSCSGVRVWVEVASNTPLRIVGRLWQRGSLETNTGTFPYLPKDSQGRIVADGSFAAIDKDFVAFQQYIPYATDPDAEYLSATPGTNDDPIASVAYCTDQDGYRYWTYQASEGASEQFLRDTLYANYTALFSPVHVRYVYPIENGYAEAEDLEADLETDLVRTLRVEHQNALLLSDALKDALNAIEQRSTLYRTTGRFTLGSGDLSQMFLNKDAGDMQLQDGRTGLTYTVQEGTETLTGTLAGDQYPDVYVILRSIATLTVSKQIEDEGGFGHWEDSFNISVTLSDTSYQGKYLVDVVTDSTLEHTTAANPAQQKVRFVDGQAELTLQHGQSISLPELPRGVTVTVTETPVYLYRTSYQILQGAKVTKGNSFLLDRHSTVLVVNTSRELTATGEDFSDGFAYALLLSGAALYGCWLLLRRQREHRN